MLLHGKKQLRMTLLKCALFEFQMALGIVGVAAIFLTTKYYSWDELIHPLTQTKVLKQCTYLLQWIYILEAWSLPVIYEVKQIHFRLLHIN